MTLHRLGRPEAGWRLRFYRIIFEADTRAGRTFDLVLLALIVLSVLVVMLDSMESLNARFSLLFDVLEWFFTAVFTIEYCLRLICVRHPQRYARSFPGPLVLLRTEAILTGCRNIFKDPQEEP